MSWQSKLVGDEDERAVSPVIGVILMVAITVILAAVIAAFVLDMGSGMEKNAKAGVNFDVDNANDEITVSAASMGNAEKIELRGDTSTSKTVDKVGGSITLTTSDLSSSTGTVTAVAVTEDGTETQVSSQDFDFRSPSIDSTSETSNSITVTVVDGSGNALEGADVTIDGTTESTGSSGEATVSGLSSSTTYSITVEFNGDSTTGSATTTS